MLINDRFFRWLIKSGTLTVIWPDGRRSLFGDGQAPRATLHFRDKRTHWRVSLAPDPALGDCFMEGGLGVGDSTIYDLLDVLLRNMGWRSGPAAYLARRMIGRPLAAIAERNAPGKARKRIAHHYDLSSALYDLFLDADRQYSCAYFARPDDTLALAQTRKKLHIAAKLALKPGQRVLDIGCGWGGMAISLAKVADIEVLGITLSQEQLKAARERAVAEGVADRVQFDLMDYRHVTGRFDRIVSVGMLEHVGRPHLGVYFNTVRRLLADDGVALIHTIGRADGPGATGPWMDKHIFPGGYSPALSEIARPIERADMYITDIEVLRLHYAETLKAWREAFLANRDQAKAIYDETFCRMWEFYLAGAEATFRYSGHVNFQIQLTRQIDAVPLIRDYMTEDEKRLAPVFGLAGEGVAPAGSEGVPATARQGGRAPPTSPMQVQGPAD